MPYHVDNFGLFSSTDSTMSGAGRFEPPVRLSLADLDVSGNSSTPDVAFASVGDDSYIRQSLSSTM